jgi:ATP-binding cassette subfamily B (MDR/TAP) protein 1
VDGDRNALWFFLISLAASVAYGVQNWVFGRTGTALGNVLRKRGFGSVLRQDGEFARWRWEIMLNANT